jgi:uncharacterized lipoprotein YddW (UPF0748 family)
MTGRRPAPVLAAVALAALAGCTDVLVPPGDRGPEVEARALWITRWDWTSEAQLVELVDRAADAGFNLIYFQARAAADAYYRPGPEPWAAGLTGSLGGDPGWDPLAVALERAHGHGLQLHAWLNAFIGWCGAAPPPESSPRHAL